jgi:hypothetical protein
MIVNYVNVGNRHMLDYLNDKPYMFLFDLKKQLVRCITNDNGYCAFHHFHYDLEELLKDYRTILDNNLEPKVYLDGMNRRYAVVGFAKTEENLPVVPTKKKRGRPRKINA